MCLILESKALASVLLAAAVEKRRPLADARNAVGISLQADEATARNILDY